MKPYSVCEIYSCLQGEGISLGVPAILVRLQGCNLRCSWCDTSFAQPITRSEETGSTYSLTRDQVVAEIKRISSQRDCPSIKHLIYTGGEPTLQPFHRIHAALGKGWTAEVETNGTVLPHRIFQDFAAADYMKFQWNVSPKGAWAEESVNLKTMNHWAKLSRRHKKVFFKFVVRQERAASDLSSILGLIQDLSIPRNRVLLMCEGSTAKSQVEATWLTEICIRENLRFTPRLHVILFENQRGV